MKTNSKLALAAAVAIGPAAAQDAEKRRGFSIHIVADLEHGEIHLLPLEMRLFMAVNQTD